MIFGRSNKRAKTTDETSSKLWERGSSGQKFDNVIILIENQVGNDYKPYLNFDFTDVYVTAMSVEGVRGKDGPPPIEYATFNFGKVDSKYTATIDDPNAATRRDTEMWTQ